MGWFMSTGLKPKLSVLNFVAQLCRDKIQKGKLRFKASLACAHVIMPHTQNVAVGF